MENYNKIEGGELQDNTVISAEALSDYDSNYVLLPTGDYDFTIVNLKESRHQDRGGKVGNCKQINPVFRVINPETGQPVDIENHNLYMWNSKGCISMIAQYFDSIGLHKKGEQLVFDWRKEKHIGQTGKLAIRHEVYKNKDGQDRTSAKISKLYPKEETVPAPASNSWGTYR